MKIISESEFEQYQTQMCNLAQVSFPNSTQPVMYFLISDEEIQDENEEEIKQIIGKKITDYLKENSIPFEEIRIEARHKNNNIK